MVKGSTSLDSRSPTVRPPTVSRHNGLHLISPILRSTGLVVGKIDDKTSAWRQKGHTIPVRAASPTYCQTYFKVGQRSVKAWPDRRCCVRLLDRVTHQSHYSCRIVVKYCIACTSIISPSPKTDCRVPKKHKNGSHKGEKKIHTEIKTHRGSEARRYDDVLV